MVSECVGDIEFLKWFLLVKNSFQKTRFSLEGKISWARGNTWGPMAQATLVVVKCSQYKSIAAIVFLPPLPNWNFPPWRIGWCQDIVFAPLTSQGAYNIRWVACYIPPSSTRNMPQIIMYNNPQFILFNISTTNWERILLVG